MLLIEKSKLNGRKKKKLFVAARLIYNIFISSKGKTYEGEVITELQNYLRQGNLAKLGLKLYFLCIQHLHRVMLC